MNARRRFLRAVRPLSRLIDKINFRIGKPPLNGELYNMAILVIQPGDIILTRTKWRPTNIIFPGKWTHCLMVIDSDLLVEAVMPVVKTSWLVDVWSGASEVLIVRPRFLTEAERHESASIAYTLIGRPYDLEFSAGVKALYCSELVYTSMRAAGGSHVPSLYRKELGVSSIRPDALANPDHFSVLLESS